MLIIIRDAIERHRAPPIAYLRYALTLLIIAAAIFHSPLKWALPFHRFFIAGCFSEYIGYCHYAIVLPLHCLHYTLFIITLMAILLLLLDII